MREFGNLLWNELEKIVKKRRFLVIVLLLLVLIPIFVYAQQKQVSEMIDRLGTDDWRLILQQQVTDIQNRLNSASLPEEWRDILQIRMEQYDYYLQHDINPQASGGPTFMREFIDQGIILLVPLLVMIVAIDIVSGEKSEGTVKLLLTRPVRRWKILLSKYAAVVLMVSLIVLTVAFLSYILSGFVFGYTGWTMPLLIGFEIVNGQLDTSGVYLIPQWLYILMAYGLGWFVSLCVATLSLMLSVLVKNTPTGMGIMLAALITGTILTEMASSWEAAKYIFSVNLDMTDYLEGTLPPIDGMSFAFSFVNLIVWSALSLIVAFWVFTRQDIYGN